MKLPLPWLHAFCADGDAAIISELLHERMILPQKADLTLQALAQPAAIALISGRIAVGNARLATTCWAYLMLCPAYTAAAVLQPECG